MSFSSSIPCRVHTAGWGARGRNIWLALNIIKTRGHTGKELRSYIGNANGSGGLRCGHGVWLGARVGM
jgi:hypothetical protein